MKKSLLTLALVFTAVLTSVTQATPQKSSASAQHLSKKRFASAKKSQSKSAALNSPPLDIDKNAVQWNCAFNQSFWLNGDFKNDRALTLYWSGKNYMLPRVPTTTGAERFQDSVSGLDLIVLPFKAMLFSDHGARSRLVDECKTLEMAAADVHSESMPLLFKKAPVGAVDRISAVFFASFRCHNGANESADCQLILFNRYALEAVHDLARVYTPISLFNA